MQSSDNEELRFRREVERYYPLLQKQARKLTGGAPESDDIAQTTIVRALERSKRWATHQNVPALLLRIARNQFIDWIRKRSKLVNITDLDTVRADAPEPGDIELGPLDRVTIDDVRRALKKINPDFAAVFELFEFEQLSYEQIAERLGISKNLVGSRMFRARAALRKKLDETLSSLGGTE